MSKESKYVHPHWHLEAPSLSIGVAQPSMRPGDLAVEFEDASTFRNVDGGDAMLGGGSGLRMASPPAADGAGGGLDPAAWAETFGLPTTTIGKDLGAQLTTTATAMTDVSKRTLWYRQKASLNHRIDETLFTNPDDPLDSCNVLLMDCLNAALPSTSSGAAPGALGRENAEDDGTDVTAGRGKRFGSRRRRRDDDHSTTTVAPDNGPSSVAEALRKEQRIVAERLQTAYTPHRRDTTHRAKTDSIVPTVHNINAIATTDVLSPAYGLEGEELRLVAGHMKRLERIEAHRLQAAADGRFDVEQVVTQSERELMHREMRDTVATRKAHSRAR